MLQTHKMTKKIWHSKKKQKIFFTTMICRRKKLTEFDVNMRRRKIAFKDSFASLFPHKSCHQFFSSDFHVTNLGPLLFSEKKIEKRKYLSVTFHYHTFQPIQLNWWTLFLMDHLSKVQNDRATHNEKTTCMVEIY